MPATPSDDRPTLAPAVESLLDTLRRRIRQYIWLEGGAAAVAWLGVAFWLTLAADWFFEPPPAVRAVMLSLVAAILLVVLVRLIGRRVFVRITAGNAATLLERRFPHLNDALLTAVTLSGDERQYPLDIIDEPLNREMLAATCRDAAARVGDVQVAKVFNPRPLWLHGSAATLLTISVSLFAILFSAQFGIWARRTLAMSNDLWPRNTRLEVVGFDDNGERKVARGADFEVLVQADTAMPQVPESVEIRYRTEGGGRGRATMDRRGIARRADDPPGDAADAARRLADSFQQYTYTFHNLLSDIRFDVRGGDDRKTGYCIHVVESPKISQMVLHCELPAYIGRKQLPMPVIGVMQIPIGSRVTVLAGQANKEIVGVQVSSVASDRPGEARQLGEHELATDRRGFSCTLEPLLSDTTLLFTLTDSDGIQNHDPIPLMLVPTPDQPPQMAVQLDGIGSAVTPLARVAVAGRIVDDYGVGRVWFEQSTDQKEPHTRTIAELPKAPAVYTLANEGLELRDLGLKPGQKLLLSVKAADRCDLGRGPNIATSERWLLDVVTPEQLRAMLEARELVLRQRFEQMIQEMTETRDLLARMQFNPGKPAAAAKKPDAVKDTKSRAVAEPGDEAPPDSPARQHDLRFLRVQGALTNCRKGAPEVLGVAEAFDDIWKQLVNNRLDTSELKNRLKNGIAEPLHAVVEKMFPDLDRRLEELQSAIDDLDRAPKVRDAAQQQAQAILLAMQKVRDQMLALEDFNEAVELLRNIVDMQKQLHDQTQQRHKEKARDLLKE